MCENSVLSAELCCPLQVNTVAIVSVFCSVTASMQNHVLFLESYA
jgi:hypothetical protein